MSCTLRFLYLINKLAHLLIKLFFNDIILYDNTKEAAKKYMSDYKKNVLKEQYLSKAIAKTE